MTVSVVVATYGEQSWREMAMEVAYPSAAREGNEVVVYHDPTGTLARARNRAASMCHCDWLCFLDADDSLADGYMKAMRPVFLVEQAKWHPAPARSLLAPAVSYVNVNGTVTAPTIPNLGRWPELNECVIGTLVPRALFDRVGGFGEWPSLEDYELWLRCVKHGATIVHVPDAVYVARAGRRRNADQSPYRAIRALNQEVFQ